MKQKAIIFIGRSGCGKGTQAKLVMDRLKVLEAEGAEKRDVLYIQTGAEIREFIKGDSVTQKTCKEIYDVGGLQPEFLAVYMWGNVFVGRYHGFEHIIFDGCPRKYHEAGVLDSIFDFYKIPRATVVHLDVSKEWSMERLLARKRLDDNKEEIEKRLGWYETEVAPTLEFYKKNPEYTFFTINAERPIADVSAEIFDKLEL